MRLFIFMTYDFFSMTGARRCLAGFVLWTSPVRWIILSLVVVSLCGVWLEQTSTSIRWVDHIKEDDMEIFFDRVVIIMIEIKTDNDTYLKTHRGLSTGVFINSKTVLTSFNAFREHIKDRDARKKVHISVLHQRHITNWKTVNYTLKNFSIDCARQIIPIADDDNIWQDNKKEQSPLHDLMVIRLNASVKLRSHDPKWYSFKHYVRWGLSTKIAGPMVTMLAPPFAKLGREMIFASLGFLNRRHIFKSCLLRSHKFAADDNVQTNCNSWIPRQWGFFICIRNIEKYKGVGSGAMLFHNNVLFGIGSFMLQKGKDSILVFTDIRKYYILIKDTCTIEDQALEMKTTSTTTTTATP